MEESGTLDGAMRPGGALEPWMEHGKRGGPLGSVETNWCAEADGGEGG